MSTPHASLSEAQCRIALVGLLYARTLAIHTETRAELFERVGKAAQQVVAGSPKLVFAAWSLSVAGREFFIWPWATARPDQLADAKIYTAKLQGTSRGQLEIHLKMALIQQRILSPAAALLGISHLSETLDTERQQLAAVLLGINAHYRAASNIRMLSDREALQAAMPALLSTRQ
jgi:hypothetical protein